MFKLMDLCYYIYQKSADDKICIQTPVSALVSSRKDFKQLLYLHILSKATDSEQVRYAITANTVIFTQLNSGNYF